MNNVLSVVGGEGYSLILYQDGTVGATGSNEHYQMGLSERKSYIGIHKLKITDVVSISTYNVYTLFLKKDGSVWGCGNDIYGQLGNVFENVIGVQQIPDLANVIAISAGSRYSLFLTFDERVFGMGDLEHMGFDLCMKLTEIPIGEGVIDVLATDQSSYFLLADGTVHVLGEFARENDMPVLPIQNVKKMVGDDTQVLLLRENNTVVDAYGEIQNENVLDVVYQYPYEVYLYGNNSVEVINHDKNIDITMHLPNVLSVHAGDSAYLLFKNGLVLRTF